jgi:hypothetical protein
MIFSSLSRLFGVISFESLTLLLIRIDSSSNVTPATTSGPMTGPLGEKDS